MASRPLPTNGEQGPPFVEDMHFSVRLDNEGATIGISHVDKLGRVIACSLSDPAGLEVHARQLLEIARDARAAAERATTGADNVIPFVALTRPPFRPETAA